MPTPQEPLGMLDYEELPEFYGIDDCTEVNDGDPWTDPQVFNGMHAREADACHASPSCDQTDTLAEIDSILGRHGVTTAPEFWIEEA